MASRMLGYAVIALVALGMAGCVATRGSLSSSAERLERSADSLQDEARDEAGGTSYALQAQEFASEARSFRRIAEDRRTDRDDVEAAFRDLSERYHSLRDQVERSRDRDAELDFERVTQAYLDVERDMSGYSDDHRRYARED
jgi:biopolymer transport protein ExbB/TolQ